MGYRCEVLNSFSTLLTSVHDASGGSPSSKLLDLGIRRPKVRHSRLGQQCPRLLDRVKIANYTLVLPPYNRMLRASNDALDKR
jgi:hypothetical protein